MRIKYTRHFKSAFLKLPIAIQKRAEQKESAFRENPFAPELKTHKLSGKLKEFYAFSIDRKHRIVFALIDRQKAVFLDIGNHDVYK